MFLRSRFFTFVSIFVFFVSNFARDTKSSDMVQELFFEAQDASLILSKNSCSELIYYAIAQENLKTLNQIDTSLKDLNSRSEAKNQKWHEALISALHEQLHLSSQEKCRLIYMLFAQYERENPYAYPSVLDVTSWKDLELLCGPKSDVTYYVGLKLDRTRTEAGKAAFFKKLITPTDDKNVLYAHQKVIKTLTTDHELFEALEKQMLILQKTESAILSFWHEDVFHDSLRQDALNIPYAKRASHFINKTPALVEMAAYTKLVSTVGANITMLAAAIALPVVGIGTIVESKSPVIESIRYHVKEQGLQIGGLLSLFGLTFKGLTMLYPESKNIKGAEGIIVGPTTAFPALFFPDYMRYIVTFRTSLQTKLMYVAQYINALDAIADLVQRSSELKDYGFVLGDLKEQMTLLRTSSDDAKQFFTLLKTKTFKGKASFFSWYGRVNVAYQLLHKIKDHLVGPMMHVAELDAYLSCVRFMKEMQQKNIPMCFPHYIVSEKPEIIIENFWNPSLTGNKAITNSLTIGHNNPGNIIVTGPNAGGKSTTMKGLLLNVILAQTFGIATASSFVLTPFSKIITYLNITDDIAAGKSHFKAGASRARELIKTVESVSYPQFTLTAVDEVFNGTTFYEGQAAAYALIEQLSNFSHNMCVTITHFPKVPLLQKDYPDRFLNYKVTASFNSNGEITYPYKIEQGISHQNIAFEILKREGFNDTFLDKATQILVENSNEKDHDEKKAL